MVAATSCGMPSTWRLGPDHSIWACAWLVPNNNANNANKANTPACLISDIETEMHDVPILDDVLFALHTQLASLLDRKF